jgi:hypothetical protein
MTIENFINYSKTNKSKSQHQQPILFGFWDKHTYLLQKHHKSMTVSVTIFIYLVRACGDSFSIQQNVKRITITLSNLKSGCIGPPFQREPVTTFHSSSHPLSFANRTLMLSLQFFKTNSLTTSKSAFHPKKYSRNNMSKILQCHDLCTTQGKLKYTSETG